MLKQAYHAKCGDGCDEDSHVAPKEVCHHKRAKAPSMAVKVCVTTMVHDGRNWFVIVLEC